MRKVLIMILLVIGTSVYAQKMTPLEVIPVKGQTISISASPTGNILMKVGTFYYSFEGTQREDFIRFIDVHLAVIESATTLGLEMDYPSRVLFYELSPVAKISSSIMMITPEILVEFYYQFRGSYAMVRLSKANLLAMKEAFSTSFSFNKKQMEKELALQKMILDAQGKFNSGS